MGCKLGAEDARAGGKVGALLPCHLLSVPPLDPREPARARGAKRRVAPWLERRRSSAFVSVPYVAHRRAHGHSHTHMAPPADPHTFVMVAEEARRPRPGRTGNVSRGGTMDMSCGRNEPLVCALTGRWKTRTQRHGRLLNGLRGEDEGTVCDGW